MDELNLYLQSLIQEACSHQPTSPQRSKAINRLLRAILNLKRNRSRDNDIYEEALYKTMFKLSKTICEKYDPNQGSVLKWFNTCLHRQYIDEIRKVNRHRTRRQFIKQTHDVELDPLDQVVADIDASLLLPVWQSFVQWIQDDPDNILKTSHIRNNPKANCQSLAYLRLVIGKEWQEIAAEVGSTRSVITSYWCRKCEPLLREWLEKNQRLFGEDNYER